MPLSFAPGEAYQFHWSHEIVVINGATTQVKVAHVRLCHSRMLFVRAYATTIHKNQGATVDRSYVLASGTMDRHLTYVAMTRHRDGVQLYAAQDEFVDRNAGRLVEHEAAPFEHRHGNSQSYFMTLETASGDRRTTWGVDLERAIAEAQPAIGDKIGLQHVGSEPVRLPDGQMVERNTWKGQDAGELAWRQLESRLSRSGVKETTLDYTRDFAERRGIAEQMGVRSEIEIPVERTGHRAERESTAESREPDRAGENSPQIDRKRPQQAEKQRRGMFAGLKLNAHPAPFIGARRAAGKRGELAAGAGARPAGRAGAAAVAA